VPVNCDSVVVGTLLDSVDDSTERSVITGCIGGSGVVGTAVDLSGSAR